MLCHNSPEFQKIVRAFSRTVTIFNPRQWHIVIWQTQRAAQTARMFPGSHRPMWHQPPVTHVQVCDIILSRSLTSDDGPGSPPDLATLIPSPAVTTSQWPDGAVCKIRDPISKPFVKTFYVQQFLFVFVVRHSSSVPWWSHVPWLGHRGQKSQASSENRDNSRANIHWNPQLKMCNTLTPRLLKWKLNWGKNVRYYFPMRRVLRVQTSRNFTITFMALHEVSQKHTLGLLHL